MKYAAEEEDEEFIDEIEIIQWMNNDDFLIIYGLN